MAITITTTLDDRSIDEIERISRDSKDLTPRNRARLALSAKQGNLIVAVSENTIAGWGLREPIGPNCSELGMTFVKPEFRDSNAFDLIAHEMANTKRKLVMATYRKGLQQYAIEHLGFRASTLNEVIRASLGGFLLKRLNQASKRSIQNRMQTSKPFFAIRDAR